MISEGRLLLLSPFSEAEKRLRKDLAVKRNLFAAAVAEEIAIAHAAMNSKTRELMEVIIKWGKPVYTINSES